jgi:hypothetical protein
MMPQFVGNSMMIFKTLKKLFLLVIPCCFALAQPDGFTALFNGRNLEGWWGLGTENPAVWMNLRNEELSKKKQDSLADIKKHWYVENGELVNDGKGLYLTTEKNFRNFELLLEYKTVPLADSGIYLRGMPQVQIWDTTEAGGKWRFGAKYGSGGLWNNRPKEGWKPLICADRPFGEWNRFSITMSEDRVTVFLNERLVVDNAPMINYWAKKGPLVEKGPIQLQTHGGEIRWKDIFLKELK